MSPWDVLGWLLVFLLVSGLALALLVPLALGFAVVRANARLHQDVMDWETQLPHVTEWKSFNHGRATVTIRAPRPGPDRSACIASDDLGAVFGSVPQIAKLLLQRRYRRVS